MGYESPDEPPLEVVRSYLEPVLGTPEAATTFERMLAAMAPDDLLAVEPALRTLDVPTLVVWGTGDDFFGIEWAHWLRDTIPGVTEVVEVAGGKLFWPDERPGDLVPHLRRHWAAADTAADDQAGERRGRELGDGRAGTGAGLQDRVGLRVGGEEQLDRELLDGDVEGRRERGERGEEGEHRAVDVDAEREEERWLVVGPLGGAFVERGDVRVRAHLLVQRPRARGRR